MVITVPGSQTTPPLESEPRPGGLEPPAQRRRLRERVRVSLREWQGSVRALERELERLVTPPE